MMQRLLRDLRFAALFLATIFLGIAYWQPKLPLQQKIFNYVFVLDITQSMNARDYRVDNLPADRLAFAKASLQYVLQHLPCQSKIGLALFTSKNVFLLFEPLEVCRHYAAIEQSLMHIDWRMAWDADSHIARGLYTGIRDIAALNPHIRLVFLSDGQQTPAAAADPAFLSKPGEIHGVVVGVGNFQPVPVPKFEQNDQPAGYWQSADAERNEQNGNGLYLSALQESALKRLASITGLQYHHLETPKQLNTALQDRQLALQETAPREIGWLFALAALVLFAAPYIATSLKN